VFPGSSIIHELRSSAMLQYRDFLSRVCTSVLGTSVFTLIYLVLENNRMNTTTCFFHSSLLVLDNNSEIQNFP
jgi:dolichyl-phosphate-mannose--protein O-mannosyl transferase